MEIEQIFLNDATEWFSKKYGHTVTKSGATFKDVILDIMSSIGLDQPLEEKHKQFLGFIFFDYCMYTGPLSFLAAELAAVKFDVKKELDHYAQDWIKESQKKPAVKN